MATGTIKRLVRDRGFGFIKQDGDGAEFFFHRSAVHGSFDSLLENQQVTFSVGSGEKGPRAENVEPQ